MQSAIPPASGRTGPGVESGFQGCILTTKNLSGVLQLLAGGRICLPVLATGPGLVRPPLATLSGHSFRLGLRWLVRVAQGPMELPSPACHGNAQCKQVPQCPWVCQLEPGAMGGQRWSPELDRRGLGSQAVEGLNPQHSPGSRGWLRGGRSSSGMGPGVGLHFEHKNKCSFLLYF